VPHCTVRGRIGNIEIAKRGSQKKNYRSNVKFAYFAGGKNLLTLNFMYPSNFLADINHH
jgi:hypothetical protein